VAGAVEHLVDLVGLEEVVRGNQVFDASEAGGGGSGGVFEVLEEVVLGGRF
jgi:hypothetical protein